MGGRGRRRGTGGEGRLSPPSLLPPRVKFRRERGRGATAATAGMEGGEESHAGGGDAITWSHRYHLPPTGFRRREGNRSCHCPPLCSLQLDLGGSGGEPHWGWGRHRHLLETSPPPPPSPLPPAGSGGGGEPPPPPPFPFPPSARSERDGRGAATTITGSRCRRHRRQGEREGEVGGDGSAMRDAGRS